MVNLYFIQVNLHCSVQLPFFSTLRNGDPFSSCYPGRLYASPADGFPPFQHEDVPNTKLQGEVLALEDERAQVLGRVEQLKVHVKELEQQLQESAREVSHEGPG